MKIAIFGGSFDPPHLGHITIVQKALQKLDIDRLFIVPTYINPFKRTFHAPPQLRLRWLKKIFLSQPKVKVCDFEIKNARPTYTIETVEYLRRRYAPKKIYIIIGSDNLPSLHQWKNYKRLKKLAKFVVATRDCKKIPKNMEKLYVKVPISSTALRAHPLQRYLPKIVAREIIRFYRS